MPTSLSADVSADHSINVPDLSALYRDHVGVPRANVLAREEVSDKHRNETVSQIGARPNFYCASDVSFEVVRDFKTFEALEDEWNALFERCGQGHQVFQTFNWCWHWCTTVGGFGGDAARSRGRTADLVILTARAGDRLVLVWPMERYTTFGVRRLGWLGRPVSQYGDVLVDDVKDKNSLLGAAWSYLLTLADVDVFNFDKVRDDSVIAPFLKTFRATRTARENAPSLEIANAVSESGELLLGPVKAQKNRRRRRRRLSEVGEISFDVLAPGDQAQKVAGRALDLKRAWLKERGLVSRALSDERTQQFFESVAKGGVRCVGARVSKLSVDGRDVAMEIGFPCKGALAVHVIVYDNAFHRYSCGALAIEDSINACQADGFKTYDLMAPGDSYKLEWTNGSVGVTDWVVPVSLKGDVWLALHLRFGKDAMKRAVDFLPDFARKLLSRAITSLMARVRL